MPIGPHEAEPAAVQRGDGGIGHGHDLERHGRGARGGREGRGIAAEIQKDEAATEQIQRGTAEFGAVRTASRNGWNGR